MSEPDPKEMRRREILRAAFQAFAEKGYDKTSMEDIVQTSGLSKGTLYWYFDSKQTLFVALVTMVFDEFQTVFDRFLVETQEMPPLERLRALLLSSAAAFDDEQLVGLYVDFFIQAWQSEAVQRALAQMYDAFTEAISAIIQDGIDAGSFRPVNVRAAARAITGAADGVMLQKLIDPGATGELLGEFADVLIYGLAKREKEGGQDA